MTSYGQTVRAIRLNKGFSQKEIYTGLVSKSYAIEFEKGHHEMGIASFLKVLNRLILNFDEFEFIHNDYQPKASSELHARHADAANTGNIADLKKLLGQVTSEKSEIMQLLAARIRLDIFSLEHQLDYDLAKAPTTDTDIIKHYLLRLASWSLEELALFANTCFYFPFETREILMESAMKNMKKYRGFHAYDTVFTGLLINFIGDTITNDRQDLATLYLAELDQVTQTIFLAFQREVYLYYTGIYQITWGNKKEGEALARYVLEHMKLLGFEKQHLDFSQQLKKIVAS